jgi:hypothetical protein
MEPLLQTLIARLDQISGEFNELREGVLKAVRGADVDPEMALTRVRKVLEYLVRDVYLRRVKEPPGTRPLENLLDRLAKDGHFPPRLNAYANTVRMLGNVGTHNFGAGISAGDVYQSLTQLMPILEWYFEVERPNSGVSLDSGEAGSPSIEPGRADPPLKHHVSAETAQRRADDGTPRSLSGSRDERRLGTEASQPQIPPARPAVITPTVRPTRPGVRSHRWRAFASLAGLLIGLALLAAVILSRRGGTSTGGKPEQSQSTETTSSVNLAGDTLHKTTKKVDPRTPADKTPGQVKTQIYFLDPSDMKVSWQSGPEGNERGDLIVPARHSFTQGHLYRLKVTDIPGRRQVQLYPTIEVARSTPQTDAFLSHSAVPVEFTAEDFAKVIDDGQFVTKLICLRDPKLQLLMEPVVESLVSTIGVDVVSGASTKWIKDAGDQSLVSRRLQAGADPSLDAEKRSRILLTVRLGAINMEMPGPTEAGKVTSQIFFLEPTGVKISWQNGPEGDERGELIVPARHNLIRGRTYSLKLTNIPGRPGVQLYPTIEVATSTPPAESFLTHSSIPVLFTAEDFDNVIGRGDFVTKVTYLPDAEHQELKVSGVETLVSTRLEPGVDPIDYAAERGTILLAVRLGAIDKEIERK